MTLRAFLLRPFLLPFALLLGVGVAVMVGVNRNDQQLRLVSDAQARTLLLNDLNTQISVMENGERGYLSPATPTSSRRTARETRRSRRPCSPCTT